MTMNTDSKGASAIFVIFAIIVIRALNVSVCDRYVTGASVFWWIVIENALLH